MLCFFLIVWHRLKNQSTPKEGLTVLINEDKELAELRSLATGVGLANACYAIQYVTRAGITGHLDEKRVRQVKLLKAVLDSVILWWATLKECP